MRNWHFQKALSSMLMFISAALMTPVNVACEAGNKPSPEKRTAGPVENEDGHTPSIGYRPPRRGAPAARIGAGTRGPDAAGPRLYALTPDHTGLTTQAQPTLYWYTSELHAARYEFSLINDSTLETVIQTELHDVDTPGFQKLSLKAHGVTLHPGVQYQWLVALVGDPKQRSKDVIAGGMIERVKDLSEREANLDGAGLESGQQAVAYAASGLWYDALATLSELIESYPSDRVLRELRATLLEQEGLQNAARRDRQVAALAVAKPTTECSG